ncbi:MAG: cytochrome c oxidase subunit II [Planctomycetes bacterium]|nr:cytochrome c oxidase subunit II [Planctomycetota bacterium]
MFQDFSLWPASASSNSGSIDALYLFLIGISVFFSLLIVTALLFFSVRYRRRPGHRAQQIEGSLPLELLWTGVPLVLCLFIFAWGTRLFYRTQTMPEEGMRFHVTGKQWMWKIRHPSGQSEINTLHLPVGQKILLTMISEDVIHSFFVPAFRVKKDVLPGMYSSLWFTPTQVGTYHLFCAEYCGTKHSEMGGQVIVMDPAEYQAWLDGRPSERNPLANGALLFQNLRCDTCHTPGPSARGPELAGRFGRDVTLSDGQTVRFDERYVRESVLEPAKRLSAGFQPLMPSYQGQIGESDILDLSAYLKSLRSSRSPQ